MLGLWVGGLRKEAAVDIKVDSPGEEAGAHEGDEVLASDL